MTFQEAYRIVLELAEQSALNFLTMDTNDPLYEEACRQDDALTMLSNISEENLAAILEAVR